MIRLALTPSSRRALAIAPERPFTTVANATPRGVWPCGSKNISTWRTLSACARRRYAQARSKKSCSVTSTVMPR